MNHTWSDIGTDNLRKGYKQFFKQSVADPGFLREWCTNLGGGVWGGGVPVYYSSKIFHVLHKNKENWQWEWLDLFSFSCFEPQLYLREQNCTWKIKKSNNISNWEMSCPCPSNTSQINILQWSSLTKIGH